MKNTERKIALEDLEEVLESRRIRALTCDIANTIYRSFGNNTNRVLNVIKDGDAMALRVFTSGLEKKKSETSDTTQKEKIDQSIKAVKEMHQLLSGNHQVITEMKAVRKHWEYSEQNRRDNTPLATWVVAESKTILEELQKDVFTTPSTSTSGTGTKLSEGKSNSQNRVVKE